MKKIWISILCTALMVSSLSGCAEQKKTNTSDASESVSVSSTNTETDSTSAGASGSSGKISQSHKETIVAPITIDSSVPIDKGDRIAVVAKSSKGEYWKTMKKNMKEAVAYLNQTYGLEGDDAITMTFEGPDSEKEVTTQINTIDAVLSENPDVLCLAAIDIDSCSAQLETAAENGIPVIIFDSGVNQGTFYGICQTDNVSAGKCAGQKLCEAIGEQGKTIVFAHSEVTETGIDRVQGFSEEVSASHLNVMQAETVYQTADISPEDMIRETLDQDPQITGIFCTNQTLSEAALTVLKEYKDRNIKLVGFDAGSIQKEAIINGSEVGMVSQDIYRMAYSTIWMAIVSASENAAKAETVEIQNTDYQWIDASNINNEEYKNILY